VLKNVFFTASDGRGSELDLALNGAPILPFGYLYADYR
jgi:hypothetical protein